jgi:hypothetical protein
MLCPHFQFAPQQTLTFQNWYTHTPQEYNTVPKVQGEILALKKEARAVCIALCLVSCIDSKFSHNPTNNIMTLYQILV